MEFIRKQGGCKVRVCCQCVPKRHGASDSPTPWQHQAEAFVVPVYAEFLDKFGKLPFSSKNREKYLLYPQPPDLKNAIKDRFLGHS